MGMFDNICIKVNCPVCGRTVDNFQTKDTDCMLDYYMPGTDRVDQKMRYLNCGAICDHSKRTISFGEHTMDNGNGHIWIDVEIPVNEDGLLSDDVDKYKISTTDRSEPWTSPDDCPLSETAKKFNEETKELVAKGPYTPLVVLDKETYDAHIKAEQKYFERLMQEVDEKLKAIIIYCKERNVIPSCNNCINRQEGKCRVSLLEPDELSSIISPQSSHHCAEWVEKDIKTDW